ncbi:MAG: aminotransferase class V-fold PLP-dependent enzyme [Gammaproteobacteria bacterium]|nr:alanine--glyoxylate aminotransferase family protein [Gammaproteobacteria bacterium]NIP87593.1 alanine--glyoxylate aminotransferase family protein [Gammaproteobacteria bacterium]NIR21918.1 alanine--glyoxylate aminotransferase family protein [Gammaproteobacteria bacterium]NIS03614.1 alanine--glyoxylate aminotransferase family protein [Gammaproteobacteria bacterium]NIU40628.1 aminotransferase class V-fold PLP-dependent enzyme [Gammaproteobacteria bacterium]
MQTLYEELNPPPRILMGPGPVDADPRVLKAMSMPLLGQFDPEFTRYMNETMDLYRRVFQTKNRWTFLIDGTARAGIEAVMTSIIIPGDKVLVPIFGRFGQLLTEITNRCGADIATIETEWGTVFTPDRIEDAIKKHRPKLVALVQGDTSTTMAQPLEEIGAICRRHDALLFVDATASITGMDLQTDNWQIDSVTAGLQKCLSGPPGSAPITFNERVEELVLKRKHVERGIRDDADRDAQGPIIKSNYFDLPMLMDYWSERRLNHHTEATSMLYAARECARIVLMEGFEARFARHALTSRALTAGLSAMGLELFGDQAHKMPNVTGVHIPDGIPGDAVRAALLENFGIEIGTSFGPLQGKIWRIGTMGFACAKRNVLTCLSALEATLRQFGYEAQWGKAVDCALSVYDGQ